MIKASVIILLSLIITQRNKNDIYVIYLLIIFRKERESSSTRKEKQKKKKVFQTKKRRETHIKIDFLLLFNSIQQKSSIFASNNWNNNQAKNGDQLDQDVECGTRSVLERITNSITNNSSSVLRSTLALATSGRQATSFDVLLGVVPGTTSVGGGDGEVDTRDEGSGNQTSESVLAEEESSGDGGSEDEDCGSDHFVEGTLGGDGNAAIVVGFFGSVGDAFVGELAADFIDHGHGGDTDGFHGHGGEPVGEHSTNEDARKNTVIKDVDDANVDTSDEGTIEGESDEGGRTNGETLTDGSGGVTSSIESISDFTNFISHRSHFGETTSVVGDGTISVDGEGSSHCGEDAKSSEGIAEDTTEFV